MKNGIKRLVVTASANGRVGSSLTMGLLHLSGFEIGPVTQTKDHNNAKGYYEVLDFQKYYRKIIPELNGRMPFVDNIEECISRAEAHRDIFMSEMKQWWKGGNIAVKTPYYLPMYLFPKEYKKIVISLRRDVESQSKSVQHLNIKKGDFALWLLKWQVQIDKHFTNDIEIWYEDWIERPYETYLRMCEVVKPPKQMTRDEVLNFIDPKLKHY